MSQASDSAGLVSRLAFGRGRIAMRYVASNDTTTIQLDVDGDGKPDLQILIPGDFSRLDRPGDDQVF